MGLSYNFFFFYFISFVSTGSLYVGFQVTCIHLINSTTSQECDKPHDFLLNIFIALFGTIYVVIIFVTQIIIEYNESKQYSKCLKFQLCSNHKLLGLICTYLE